MEAAKAHQCPVLSQREGLGLSADAGQWFLDLCIQGSQAEQLLESRMKTLGKSGKREETKGVIR